MTKKEAIRQTEQQNTLINLGFTRVQAESLRRISITLQHWYERECGDGNGCIERDEATGRTFWVDHSSSKTRRWPIPDRETGAIRRFTDIVATVPQLSYYLQTDPRGAALYILRPGDVPEGTDADSCYSRGVCVY
jgi:hypothetical protein